MITLLLQSFVKCILSLHHFAILIDHHAFQLLQQRLGSDELGDVEALVVLPLVRMLQTYTLTQ